MTGIILFNVVVAGVRETVCVFVRNVCFLAVSNYVKVFWSCLGFLVFATLIVSFLT
jgi:hypothetical protein